MLFAAGNPFFVGLYLLAILLAEKHGASSAQIGVMFAVVGAGGLLGAVVAGPLSKRLSGRGSVIAQQWVLAATFPLLFVFHAAVAIGMIVAAAEFLTPLTNSLVVGERIELTPDRLRGRVQAAVTTMTMSFAWLGPLVVGVAFQRAGETATVLALTTWALILAAAASLAPALRRPPQPATPESAQTATERSVS